MKNIIAILSIFLLLIVSAACQDNEVSQQKNEAKLLEIASSTFYAEYMSTIQHRAYLVATKAYDWKDLDPILEKYPDEFNTCDIDRDLFKDVPGGYLWYDCDCKLEQTLNKLNTEYNYNQYSLEEMSKIRSIYNTLTQSVGEKDLINKISKQFSKN
ncbi:MAG TPA: hypothetical protein PKC76_04005 [Saprospiraceae bacterium]|nr:hypothetical protein [Saprospiraceae bacterium]HMP23266.1 hypothetical protein [Saprospiraceae bacterium]